MDPLGMDPLLSQLNFVRLASDIWVLRLSFLSIEASDLLCLTSVDTKLENLP